MEGYLALMIPIIALTIPVIALWTKHQQKMAEMQVGAAAEQTAEKAAQYVGQIQRLEARVQVLERIVTDRGYDVATQIEALRDQRRVDEDAAGVPLGLNKERV
ncbi:hypothetical protein [Porphyrobacter sp. YT40]|uniref:hypothetical protein n=1 Tax=Porphyrobacter sp. YT40 TaxID=2547601 RepID=UPI001144EE6F|nr:hypothetical protein [Porphyrobacter sp. YT40]QDH34246.1 hypothetical protein E2E27_07880 [Porphyrobacter sp. YT40]